MPKSTMMSLVVEQAGQHLQVREHPIPRPAQGQVLVKITASAVNPLDLKIQAGAAAHAKHSFPAVLGIDMAGVIEALGPDVTDWKVGDRVYGMTGGVGGHQGSFAQFAAVDARLLAHTPMNLTDRQAAAIPLGFITAWEGLVDRAKVARGMKVLIQGGAGGVGHLGIQIAKSFGATVFATGSIRSVPDIERLGAIVIDRASAIEDYVERHTAGRGFDVILDTAGGTALDAAFRAVARNGHVASALGWGSHSLAPLSFKSATYSGVFTLLPLLTGEGREHYGKILAEATRLAESNALTPLVDATTFKLEQAQNALLHLGEGRNTGKVIIEGCR